MEIESLFSNTLKGKKKRKKKVSRVPIPPISQTTYIFVKWISNSINCKYLISYHGLYY